ncbi:hypothetical protein ACOMHN_030908 [Nucella lapillus]
MRAARDTGERIEKLPPIAPAPSLPLVICPSKKRTDATDYLWRKAAVESAPISPLQAESEGRMMDLLPDHLKNKPTLRQCRNELFDEVRQMYVDSMKKHMVQLALKLPPDNCYLVDEDAGPVPSEPKGMDFSNPWHSDYEKNRRSLQEKLHLPHPVMRGCLDLCERFFGNIVLFDITKYQQEGVMEFETLKNNIILDLEKKEDNLKTTWFPEVAGLVSDKKNLHLRPDKVQSFFKCLDTLMSNKLKDLVYRSICHFMDNLSEEYHLELPTLKLELVLDEETMTFFPPSSDFKELLTFIIKQTNSTMQKISTVQSFVEGWDTVDMVVAEVQEHMLADKFSELAKKCKAYFTGPSQYLHDLRLIHMLVDKFMEQTKKGKACFTGPSQYQQGLSTSFA